MKLAWLIWMTSILPQPLANHTCLATTIYLEARSQPVIGQFAVAEVAMRRRQRGTWGKTVCDVVKAPHQFAFTTTPGSYQVTNINAFIKAWKIAGESIATWNMPRGKRVLVVPGADHFATTTSAPNWGAMISPLKTIGNHTFYAVN